MSVEERIADCAKALDAWMAINPLAAAQGLDELMRSWDATQRGKPVFVAHGLYDSVLPIDEGRAIEAELKRYPVLMTYKEYPMGHEVSPQSIADIQTFLTDFLNP